MPKLDSNNCATISHDVTKAAERNRPTSTSGDCGYDHSFQLMNSSAGGRFAGLKSVPSV
jgi:hypothetical protein